MIAKVWSSAGDGVPPPASGSRSPATTPNGSDRPSSSRAPSADRADQGRRHHVVDGVVGAGAVEGEQAARPGRDQAERRLALVEHGGAVDGDEAARVDRGAEAVERDVAAGRGARGRGGGDAASGGGRQGEGGRTGAMGPPGTRARAGRAAPARIARLDQASDRGRGAAVTSRPARRRRLARPAAAGAAPPGSCSSTRSRRRRRRAACPAPGRRAAPRSTAWPPRAVTTWTVAVAGDRDDDVAGPGREVEHGVVRRRALAAAASGRAATRPDLVAADDVVDPGAVVGDPLAERPGRWPGQDPRRCRWASIAIRSPATKPTLVSATWSPITASDASGSSGAPTSSGPQIARGSSPGDSRHSPAPSTQYAVPPTILEADDVEPVGQRDSWAATCHGRPGAACSRARSAGVEHPGLAAGRGQRADHEPARRPWRRRRPWPRRRSGPRRRCRCRRRGVGGEQRAAGAGEQRHVVRGQRDQARARAPAAAIATRSSAPSGRTATS